VPSVARQRPESTDSDLTKDDGILTGLAALLDENAAVDTKTAGRILGIKPKTLANWRSLGVGPEWCKFGNGRVTYIVGILLAYRAACRRNGHGNDRGASSD
jgi:hypothetical protein